MLKIPLTKTATLFLAAVLMPLASMAIEDCGTTRTQCQIKELQQQNQAQQQEIKDLRQQNKTLQGQMKNLQDQVNTLKSQLLNGGITVASSIRARSSSTADSISNKKTTCSWHHITTHGRFTCPTNQFAVGICLTNKTNGCPGGNPTGSDSTWVTAGAVQCCNVD